MGRYKRDDTNRHRDESTQCNVTVRRLRSSGSVHASSWNVVLHSFGSVGPIHDIGPKSPTGGTAGEQGAPAEG